MSPTVLYSLLGVAILLEVVGTTLLAQTAQFTRPLPTLGTALCYAVSFYCLSIITSSLPVGVVYAVWSGLGIVFVAGLNFVLFRQALDPWAMFGMALIQCVKVIHLVHTGLAAAEPEIYNGERIIGKKTAAYAVAVQILSFKLRECAGRLRHRLAGSFILRQCCDLCFDLTDFVRIGL